MAELKVQHTISLDVAEPNWSDRLYVVQGTDNEVTIQVRDLGAPVDLTDVDKVLLISRPAKRGAFPVFSKGTVTDAASGVVVVSLNRAAITHTGVVESQLKMYGAERRHISTAEFETEVERSTDENVPSPNDYSFVEETLESAKVATADAEQAADSANATSSELTSVVGGALSSLNQQKEEALGELGRVTVANETHYGGTFSTAAERDATYPDPYHGLTVTIADETAGLSTTYRYVDSTIDNTVSESTWVVTDHTNNPKAINQLNQQISEATEQLQSVEATKMDKNTTDISVAQINKNKGKFDQTYLTDELLQQMTGGAPVNATPPNGGVTTPKIARKAVEVSQTTFLEYGKNIYNHDARTVGYSLDNFGAPIVNADYDVTDFIPVTAGLTYTLNNPRVVFFYDADKNLIGTKVDNSTHLALTVTPPEGASYLRASIYKSNSPTFQVERGETVTAFEPFKLRVDKIEVRKENLGFKAVANQHLEDDSITAEKISIVSLGKNLFNIKEAIDGFYLQETSGNLIANASFVTSGFISVKAGTTYTISSSRKFVRYDMNKVYVSGINQTQAAYTFTAQSDGYIRFSYSKDLASDVQMEVGSSVTTFEPYGFRMPDLVVDENDVLNGKSLYSFGDSIMFGAGNGGVGLRDLIAQKYGMTGNDYAISGASIAYYSDRSHIVKQIQDAIAAGITPDYIIMNGGINDVTFNVLGDVAADYNYMANGFASFSAGLEYCFGLLKTTFPTVPLIYIWVHHMPSRKQPEQLAHHDRALEICEKWSVPVVDMYKDGGMNTMLTSHLQNYTFYPTENSGTHPNGAGYELFYVPPVVDEIRRRTRA